MKKYLLINRPAYNIQLVVSIFEDNSSYKFIVESGYSFAEIAWSFYKLDDLYDSDRKNVELLLNRNESIWLYNVLIDINTGKKNWEYSEIIDFHRKMILK